MTGVSINMLSNVREAVRGVDSVADAVEDVEGRLRDLTKEGDTATDRMADDFKDFAKTAERQVDAVRDAMRQAFKDSRASVKDATDDAAKDVKKFGDTAKDEFRDSAREGAASFSGEISDIGDVLQETAANLGPPGIAGAAVIGAVASTATASVDAWNEKIQGIQDATADMWQDAAAEGQKFVDGEAIRAETTRILWDKTYEGQFAAAEKAGVKRSELASAIASGEGEIYDRVHQQLIDAYDEEGRKVDENYDKYTAAGEGIIRVESAHGQELARTIDILDAKAQAVDDNKARAQQAADADRLWQEQTREQIDRTARAMQERYEGLAAKYGQPIKAVLEVDDSKLRGYRPPTIHIPGRIVPFGQRQPI